MVPIEADNHQLIPAQGRTTSSNMLALFFILQVNYHLTCSFISPFNEVKHFLEKDATVNILYVY